MHAACGVTKSVARTLNPQPFLAFLMIPNSASPSQQRHDPETVLMQGFSHLSSSRYSGGPMKRIYGPWWSEKHFGVDSTSKLCWEPYGTVLIANHSGPSVLATQCQERAKLCPRPSRRAAQRFHSVHQVLGVQGLLTNGLGGCF